MLINLWVDGTSRERKFSQPEEAALVITEYEQRQLEHIEVNNKKSWRIILYTGSLQGDPLTKNQLYQERKI
jgi:hypothetical protein